MEILVVYHCHVIFMVQSFHSAVDVSQLLKEFPMFVKHKL